MSVCANLTLVGISYQHPGLFKVWELAIHIDMQKVSRFLLKLSAAMMFDHYDKLTKAVYLGNMQAERKVCALAEKEPKYPLCQDRCRLLQGDFVSL